MRGPLYSVVTSSGKRVSIAARPRGEDWLYDDIRLLYDSGVTMLVSLLTQPEVEEFGLLQEEAYCRQQDIRYFSFAIEDRCTPSSMSQTYTFVRNLAVSALKGQHVAFHCRQGIGRAALMAACLLVLLGLSPEQALAQLSQARGYPLPETEGQREWLLKFNHFHIATVKQEEEEKRTRATPEHHRKA